MKFILIHIKHISNFVSYNHCTNNIPEYLWHSILQIKKWGNNDILLISDKSEFTYIKNKMKEHGISKITFLPYNKYLMNFQFNGLSFFRFVTYFRLLVLYEIMKEYNFSNVCHIEYDNLIYFNENEYNWNNKVCFPLVGDNLGSAGIIFINNHENFKPIVEHFRKHYNEEYLSDMNLLYQCKDMNNIYLLPTMEDDKNFSTFNNLFDGASWGQYIGGSPNGHGPGLAEPHHYIGKRLLNKEYNIGFQITNDNKKIPVVVKNNMIYRLFNLHIHSKNLKEYIS